MLHPDGAATQHIHQNMRGAPTAQHHPVRPVADRRMHSNLPYYNDPQERYGTGYCDEEFDNLPRNFGTSLSSAFSTQSNSQYCGENNSVLLQEHRRVSPHPNSARPAGQTHHGDDTLGDDDVFSEPE